MLAVVTTNSISAVEPKTLKQLPSSVPSSSQLESPAISACWSTDSASLYLASQYSIYKHHLSSKTSTEIHSVSEIISHVVAKDKSTLIFSAGNTIHSLESITTTPKPSSQTYTSHKSTINSLSLSCDNTLLLSTTSAAVHIHNLTHNSTSPTTILRGLPSSHIRTAVFHPYVRTRALVGAGNQLLLCDTTRPSTPLKTFTITASEGGGEIVAIACSTFSKTLVAVALGGVAAGTIGLVDLDKEKGLFRTINTKVPVSTLSFSPEGSSIYAGTETGRLLVLNLRTLDEPPTSVDIEGSNDERVVAICLQKKTKSDSAQPSPARKASTMTSPATTRRIVSTSKPVTPSRGTRVVSSMRSATNVAKPGNKTTREETESKRNLTVGPTAIGKKVFSPLRSPLANSSNRKAEEDANGDEEFSVKLETLDTIRRPATQTSPSVSRKASTLTVSSRPTTRTRTISTTSSISKVSVAAPTVSPKPSTSSPRGTISGVTAPSTRTRALGESVSTAAVARPSGSRALSSRSRTKTGEEKTPSVPPVPPLPKDVDRQVTGRKASSSRTASGSTTTGADTARPRERTRTRTQSSRGTKTPSPDLPGIDHEVGLVTPAAKLGSKGLAMRALGLGTPGISLEKGKGKAKSVEFFEEEEAEGGAQLVAESDEEVEDLIIPEDPDQIMEDHRDEYANDLSMQISPARRRGVQSNPSDYNNIFSTLPISPPRPSGLGSQPSHHPQSPQNLLRTIVHSVLSDFHLQTHREMTNLHLDLVRMGRGWRKDVREVVREEMEGVMEGMMKDMREDVIREIREAGGSIGNSWKTSGDLMELREENKRLREENEKLRKVIIGQVTS
ncbi:hypothetical protein VNI00_008745 [Paramarasmius palmivorus]|uniref:WD40 repeat-like protein n=1 Tax=Paramarasmius palmivorus TaxID=297713 RepID=A0AAW0CWI9_9AGAR